MWGETRTRSLGLQVLLACHRETKLHVEVIVFAFCPTESNCSTPTSPYLYLKQKVEEGKAEDEDSFMGPLHGPHLREQKIRISDE